MKKYANTSFNYIRSFKNTTTVKNRFHKLCPTLLAITILVFGQQQLNADIILNDGMNDSGSYSDEWFGWNSGNSEDISNYSGFNAQVTGGNPGAFLSLDYSHDVNRWPNGTPLGSGFVSTAGGLLHSFSYNPFFQGPINDISFSLDIRFQNNSNVAFNELFFFIEDGSETTHWVFKQIIPGVGEGGPNWQFENVSGLTSLDFPGIDFSEDVSLSFGFGFTTNGDVTGGPVALSMDVDNFVVSINAVPEPSSFLLLGSLMMFSAGRRRIRQA